MAAGVLVVDRPAPGAIAGDSLVQQALAIAGATFACVIHIDSGRILDRAGQVHDEVTAMADWCRTATAALITHARGSGGGVNDVVVTAADHIYLARPLPGRVLLLVSLDRRRTNLATAQRGLQAVQPPAEVIGRHRRPCPSPRPRERYRLGRASQPATEGHRRATARQTAVPLATTSDATHRRSITVGERTDLRDMEQLLHGLRGQLGLIEGGSYLR